MPEHEFEIYLSVLSRLVKLNPDQKAAIADELRDHLEERFEELVRVGQDRDEAIRQALDEFGDASGLALDLTTVSKKRIPRWVIRSTAVSASAAMLLLAWMFLFAPPDTIPNGPTELSAQQPSKPVESNADNKAGADAKKPKRKPAPLVLSLGKDDLEAPFLNERIAMEFIDTPLSDVAKFISQKIDEAVLIDVAALENHGLSPDEPITFSVGKPVVSAKQPADPFGSKVKSDKANNAVEKPDAKQEHPDRPEVEHAIPPLSESLSIMLAPLGLNWHVADGILRITTNEQAEEIQITQNYNIEALLARGISTNEITYAVTTLAAGCYWEPIDGAGGELMIVENILSVRHDYQSQREIRDVLRAIVAPAPQRFVRQHDTTIATIELLRKQVSADFIDTPLKEAVTTLSQLANAPIRLDAKALTDEGFAMDTPVTLKLKKSLETVLDVMLAPLEFTFTIRHGEIFITSFARAEDELLLGAVYQLPTRDEVGRQKIQNSLQEMTSGIWADIDGEGGELMTLEDGTLCVWQSYKVQREIERLLTLYRQSLQPKQERAANSNELVTKFYRVPMETALDLVQVLPEYVEADSWFSDTNPGGGTIQVISLGRKSSGRSAPRNNTGANSNKNKNSKKKADQNKNDSAAKTSQTDSSLPFLRDGLSPQDWPATDAAVLAQFGGAGFGSGGFGGGGLGSQSGSTFGDFSNYAEEAVLVIRQTPIVHGKIDQFLLSLGLRTVGKTHVSEGDAKYYGATHGGQPRFGGGGGGGFFSIRND